MTINRIAYVQKDGPYKRNYYRRTIDISKPKCWVEGFQYCFNSVIELMAVELLPHSKITSKKVGNKIII